jgi:predicted small metal-binding protein
MNNTNWDKWSVLEEKMTILRCNDYGYQCDFKVEGEVEHVMAEFGKHCIDSHGIEYGKDVIGQIIRRKYPGLKIQ